MRKFPVFVMHVAYTGMIGAWSLAYVACTPFHTESTGEQGRAQGEPLSMTLMKVTGQASQSYALDSARGQLYPCGTLELGTDVVRWGQMGPWSLVRPVQEHETPELLVQTPASEMRWVNSASLSPQSDSNFVIDQEQAKWHRQISSYTCPAISAQGLRLAPITGQHMQGTLGSRGDINGYVLFQIGSDAVALGSAHCIYQDEDWQPNWTYPDRKPAIEFGTASAETIPEDDALAPTASADFPSSCAAEEAPSDSPYVPPYDPARFVLRMLSFLPPHLRHQLDPHWKAVLDTPAGQVFRDKYGIGALASQGAINDRAQQEFIKLDGENKLQPDITIYELANMRQAGLSSPPAKSSRDLAHLGFDNLVDEALGLLRQAADRLALEPQAPHYGFFVSRRAAGTGSLSKSYRYVFYNTRANLWGQHKLGPRTFITLTGGPSFAKETYYALWAQTVIDRWRAAVSTWEQQGVPSMTQSSVVTSVTYQYDTAAEKARIDTLLQRLDEVIASELPAVRPAFYLITAPRTGKQAIRIFAAPVPPLSTSSVTERAQLFFDSWAEDWIRKLDAQTIGWTEFTKYVHKAYVSPNSAWGVVSTDAEIEEFMAELKSTATQCSGGHATNLGDHVGFQKNPTLGGTQLIATLSQEGRDFVVQQQHALACLVAARQRIQGTHQ